MKEAFALLVMKVTSGGNEKQGSTESGPRESLGCRC